MATGSKSALVYRVLNTGKISSQGESYKKDTSARLCILVVEELVVASPTPVLLSGCLLPEECHGNDSIVAATYPLHRLQADQCNLQE